MQTENSALAPTVSAMKTGESAVITAINADGAAAAALASHGIAVGEKIRFVKSAPLGDPVQLGVKGGNVCIRKKDAAVICVARLQEAEKL